MTPEGKWKILTAIFFASSCFWLLGYIFSPKMTAPEKIEFNDTENTVCYLFDLSASGWSPVSYQNRQRISLLVSDKKAGWMPVKGGIECYSKKIGPELGTKVAEFDTEYWRWLRK